MVDFTNTSLKSKGYVANSDEFDILYSCQRNAEDGSCQVGVTMI